MMGSLQRTLGDLDRVTAWVKLLGMVNAVARLRPAPGRDQRCSDLILEVFGERDAHARSAVAWIGLPWNISVEVEGEVLIAALIAMRDQADGT